MRVIDYHMHTHFSGDSEANPREHVLKAIEMNLQIRMVNLRQQIKGPVFCGVPVCKMRRPE